MARWSRAARLLPADARRVLDLGCAFGHGTRRLARGRCAIGVDVNEAYIRRAARSVAGARFLLAAGARLPFAAASFDAITCLDVIEHVPDERALLAEAHRVLRPGGTLVLSVPHRGPLTRFDSVNLMPDLWNLDEIAPLRDPAAAAGETHWHYSLFELRSLLGRRFRIERVERTGLGLAELVNLPLLWLSKRLLKQPRLYDALQYVYFTAYMAEDLIPMGRLGYHLMVRARRQEAA